MMEWGYRGEREAIGSRIETSGKGLVKGGLSGMEMQARLTPHFIVPLRPCGSYRSKVCGNPESGESMGPVFPAAFAHFQPLCHSLVILAIVPTSHYYCISYGAL